MGWQLGIDAGMVRDQSTITVIRDGRFVETRHVPSMTVTLWPGFVADIITDLGGVDEVRVDTRGIGGAVYDVLKDAKFPVVSTSKDQEQIRNARYAARGLK